ncbi:hypothetical protein [Pseudobutyrivibrio ruminis]|nr:hypothetical protein [Pseudobutyrivibrio ruminis]
MRNKKIFISLLMATSLLAENINAYADESEPDYAIEDLTEPTDSDEECNDVVVEEDEDYTSNTDEEKEDEDEEDDEEDDEEKEDEEKVQIEEIADSKELIEEEEENLEEEEKVVKKALARVATIYHLKEDGTVVKINRTITEDEEGNIAVEDIEEEIGEMIDGEFYLTHMEPVEYDLCHINIEYSKEIEKIENFNGTESMKTTLNTNFTIGAGESIMSIEHSSDISDILSKIDFGDTVNSGVDIVASIDIDGNISIESAVAREPEHIESEIKLFEKAEMDFEFDVEYSDEEILDGSEEETDSNTEEDAVPLDDAIVKEELAVVEEEAEEADEAATDINIEPDNDSSEESTNSSSDESSASSSSDENSNSDIK